MNKHTHTPGPWIVGPVDDCTVTAVDASGERHVVAEIDGDYNEPDLWPTMEANARLIAAAPDLLEASKPITDCITGLSNDVPDNTLVSVDVGSLRKLRAAATKAEASPIPPVAD